MANALRALLISRGAIVPKQPRPTLRPVVLRMDDRGKRAAALHIAEYDADPYTFNSRAFWFPPPEDWIDTPEYPSTVRQS